MGQRQHHLVVTGSFLALSIVLLIAASAIQASGSHFGSQENLFKASIPKIGYTYLVDIDGSARIPGKSVVKQASAELTLKVINVKSTGIPTIHFELISGALTFGSDEYTLEKGTVVLQTNKLTIKVTTNDGTKILTVYSALAGSLPLKTSEDPVKLTHAQDRKSASIQILADKWFLSFGGLISRTG